MRLVLFFGLWIAQANAASCPDFSGVYYHPSPFTPCIVQIQSSCDSITLELVSPPDGGNLKCTHPFDGQFHPDLCNGDMGDGKTVVAADTLSSDGVWTSELDYTGDHTKVVVNAVKLPNGDMQSETIYYDPDGNLDDRLVDIFAKMSSLDECADFAKKNP